MLVVMRCSKNLFKLGKILILMLKVHLGCWNSTQSILAWLQAEGKGDKEEDFMFLWNHFLTRAELSMKNAAQSLEQNSPKMTIWSNQMTHPDNIHFMDK